MPNKTISQLPAVEAAETNAVIACDNAAGTTTQKVTIGQIVALAGSGNPFDQDLNTDDTVQFAGIDLVAPAPVGETVPGITITPTELQYPNGTKVLQGSFDNATGGSNGLSLYCAVGYELNWQGGRLACTVDGGVTFNGIVIDSQIQCMDGIVFGDSTEQQTAWTGSVDWSSVTSAPAFVPSDPTGITGADAITNIVSLTQAEYDALASTDPATLYVIT